MDFDYTEEQSLLIDTVREFVKKDSPVARLRKLRDSELGWEKATWKRMGELGWLGVMFPESVGGAGMSFVEMGLILTELGTALVPEPMIPLVTAGVALLAAGNAEQQARFLAPAVAGDESLALAWAEVQGRHNPLDLRTTAKAQGGSYRLSGHKRWVDNGHGADHLVVSARTSGDPADREGVSLFVIDPGMKGVTLRKVQRMDGQKAAMLELSDVEVSADRRLGAEGTAGPVLEHVMDYGAAACVCEANGILQSVLWMTRNYLMERKQFGVPIGSFQALQHRAVDMFVETELTKSCAILAMLGVAHPDAEERRRAISVAKAQVAESGAFVTRQGIQLHGGIGVTDEHDVGLFFKRMHVLGMLFGDDAFHLQRFAHSPSFTRSARA